MRAPEQPSSLWTRRIIAILIGLIALAAAWIGASPHVRAQDRVRAQDQAQEKKNSAPAWRHGLSLRGDLKYPSGFARFEYVNPEAPKGGVVRLGAQGGFDNFNIAVSGLKGDIEPGISRIYDTLMTPSLDESGSEYGLLAEAVRPADDFSSVTYRLRSQARWHDGVPVSPDDVVFSFQVLKTNSPVYAFYYKNVVEAVKTGEHEVTFHFDQAGNRELPQIIGQLPILPKHWWDGMGASGTKRDVTLTSLEPPLGSGPYRLKTFDTGHSSVYERVADYWGKDLPVNVGRNNFDEIHTDYFLDATVLVEAFKADRYDWRVENVAKNWAAAYDIAAVHEGRIVREEFAQRASGVMQAFVFNLRRDKFADARVRRAFNLAFNFEEINRSLFFGQYQRVSSFFHGTELAASGVPDEAQRAILQSVKAEAHSDIPDTVFTQGYANPVNATPELVRENLREADRLLREAGYEVRGRERVKLATGEPLSVEFLGYDPSLERYVLTYKAALERLGIAVSLRIVDPAQYQNRLRQFDFDIVSHVWGQSLSPGNEQRDLWGSPAADQPGSSNLAGIKNPAVDALIERVIFAKDRETLVSSVKSLDRVLLANDYVVPQWTYRFERTLRWNRFSHPGPMPDYGASAFPSIWWFDASKAKTVGVPN